MTIVGKILRTVGGIGLSIVGGLSGASQVSEQGGSMLASVFSKKVRTDFENAAGETARAQAAYNAAMEVYSKQSGVTAGIPQWLIYVGGGLCVLIVLKLLGLFDNRRR
jgi:hypothetical protein